MKPESAANFTLSEDKRGVLDKGWTDNAHYILADSSLTDERIRVLKHGDTFAIFDHYGNIKPVRTGEEGIYHEGTRFLSALLLELEGSRPFFLSSTVRDDNDQLTVALTNPDLRCRNLEHLPLGSLHIARRIFLWQGACYQEISIQNHARAFVETSITLRYAADFADIYEIRGMARKARGEDLQPGVDDHTVVLSYRGLDGVVRRSRIRFSMPVQVTPNAATFDVRLNSREIARVYVTVSCELSGASGTALLSFEEARAQAQAELKRYKANSCSIRASNGQFNAWVDRAMSDLHMMTTLLPTGPYPYAGVPWFNTPFGRDGLITAFECLWFWPDLARGVLSYLAETQATSIVPEEDAEPGKILHETRSSEMAALKEMPFGRYYGSVDGTPLFVLLAGAYYQRTGDLRFIKDLWPNVQAALRWIEQFGDRDADGFVEYRRQSGDGLIHQGWKDADDAIFNENGSIVSGPVALCEVQAYTYGAWEAAALLCDALGLEDSERLRGRADHLRDRFNERFWCDELSTFALALDGAKVPCRVRTSNAGQCLFPGIATPENARRVAQTLMTAESFSGWGVRTVAEGEARFNPMAYHNGSVWPHDNALIAHGLARYGFTDEALRIFQGLFEAAMYFDMHRMPELFCGFAKEHGEGPVLYPVACSPQSWSAASVFLLFQATLGLQVDGVKRRIALVRPALPAFLNEVEITNLQVGTGQVDLILTRHADGVSVNVTRRHGDTEVVVIK